MKLHQQLALLLIALFTIGIATNSDAQFWKKKSKRHKHSKQTEATTSDSTQSAKSSTPDNNDAKKTKAQRKKEKKERKKREKEARRELKKANKKYKGKTQPQTVAAPVAPTVKSATVVRQWSDIEYPASQRKSHYRIDILAPMYLDELVKNGYPVKTIPEKAIQGLDFYKGVQIAADTLKKAQFDIDIYVHDVASVDEATDMLVSKNMMDSSDLIIGAVTPKDVAALADYARRKKINFVSALTPADGGVKDNQYLTILSPTIKSQCEKIVADVQGVHMRNKGILLYRTNTTADDEAARCLEGGEGKNLYSPVLCNTIPARVALSKLIDTAHVNIVVVAIDDPRYADSLVKTLKQYYPATHFEIYGLASWARQSTGTTAAAYPNMQFNIVTPFVFNEQSALIKYVAGVFRTEYGGKPEEQVYRGYETMFWYANMLKRYGTIFNKQYSDNETAPFTHFAVKPQWDDKTGNVLYFENRHLYVRHFSNGMESIRD